MVNGNDSQNWPVKRFCWKFVVEKYQFRKELKNLTQELEDWEWHENRDLESKVVIDFGRHGDLWNYTSYVKGLWGQFFFLGNGKTSLDLEGHHCQVSKVSQKRIFWCSNSFTVIIIIVFQSDHPNFLQRHVKIHCSSGLCPMRGERDICMYWKDTLNYDNMLHQTAKLYA